ncbi:TOBE domain-containing protein [Rubrivivax sp. RP6-9]|uniref:TOBE domain-containing protein n=1 Tax=Rubrivivax sp. RP6-9 TaxID=3415750 RepID=UPI003CC5A0B3
MATRRQSPRLTGRLEVSTELGSFLGDTRVRLLEAIDAHGSISQAARHVPISYKAAWDAVDAMNNLAERALVESSTGGRAGGGTRLTEHGRRVVAMYRAVEAEYQTALDRLAGRYATDAAADMPAFRKLLRRMAVRSSARNQFAGTVAGVHGGPVDCVVHVALDAATTLVASVTRASVQTLGLVVGSEVVALVKAPAVALVAATDPVAGTAPACAPASAPNRFRGAVERIVDSPVNAEVTLALGGGRTATAVVPRATLRALRLKLGAPACAVFPPSSVILAVLD